MGDVEEVVAGLQSEACTHLTVFDCGDDEAISVAGVLEAGGGLALHYLEMGGAQNITAFGAEKLAATVESGACPWLETLSLGDHPWQTARTA